MLKRILNMLTTTAETAPQQGEQRIHLAACVLLLEIAHADGEYHENEDRLIRQLIQDHFELDTELVAELMELAHQSRTESHDLHQFTREINSHFDQADKERIMESLWQLVYADGHLDHFEEALLRQLSTLIGLSHRQMIEAKLAVCNGDAGSTPC
ncbi:MAG: hypothetical protein C0618_12280 [Desulfuromonas sp.]|nr:MAG: hypothetical protein C0618_12280 [Desulfuromonas sp.]